jgi:hypothetical protein
LEKSEKIEHFIESSLPYLRSHWNEIRANACIVIGLLHHHGGKSIENQQTRIELETTCSEKISLCLKDENIQVKVKAAEALGHLFSEP